MGMTPTTAPPPAIRRPLLVKRGVADLQPPDAPVMAKVRRRLVLGVKDIASVRAHDASKKVGPKGLPLDVGRVLEAFDLDVQDVELMLDFEHLYEVLVTRGPSPGLC